MNLTTAINFSNMSIFSAENVKSCTVFEREAIQSICQALDHRVFFVVLFLFSYFSFKDIFFPWLLSVVDERHKKGTIDDYTHGLAHTGADWWLDILHTGSIFGVLYLGWVAWDKGLAPVWAWVWFGLIAGGIIAFFIRNMLARFLK